MRTYYWKRSPEEISQLENDSEFLSVLRQRQKVLTWFIQDEDGKYINWPQLWPNGIDGDYVNTIISIHSALYEFSQWYSDINDLVTVLKNVKNPYEYFKNKQAKSWWWITSEGIVWRLRLPHVIPIFNAIRKLITRIKEIAYEIEKNNDFTEENENEIKMIDEKIRQLIYEVWNTSSTVTQIKKEVSELLELS